MTEVNRDRVRNRGCRVYIADMKAQIQSLNRYYYPDVMVTCDDRFLIFERVVVEEFPGK
jgi:Uma2 family endonuclease